MINQIPIKVHDFKDYALTARERMEIYDHEKYDPFIISYLMEINYMQNKMILDLENVIAEAQQIAEIYLKN